MNEILFAEKQQEDKQSLKKELLSKLKIFNPQYIEEENGNIITYELKESLGYNIPLSQLPHYLKFKLNRDPRFQRDSNDHKQKTPQQIVMDYLSGQFMGNITCYDDKKTLRKTIIDGKHRLTHLENFLNGDLILKDRAAAEFWTRYLNEIISINGIVSINKIIKKIKSIEIDSYGNITGNIPQVNFTDFPQVLKDSVTNEVQIHVTDIQVVSVDKDNIIHYDVSYEKAEELLFKKFLRINQNSAKIEADDVIWGAPGDYNEFSRKISNSAFFKEFFKLENKNIADSIRKLNEIIYTIQLFLDKKYQWNSSTTTLSKKVSEYVEYEPMGNGLEFKRLFEKSIIPNFQNYFLTSGIKIPEEMHGINGRSTNIKYMILFMYILLNFLEKDKKIVPFMDKIPTPSLISIIELGAKIIVASNTTNNDPSLEKLPTDKTHLIYEYKLSEIYNSNPNVFIKIHEYRKSNRKEDEIMDLFNELVSVCIESYLNGKI